MLKNFILYRLLIYKYLKNGILLFLNNTKNLADKNLYL